MSYKSIVSLAIAAAFLAAAGLSGPVLADHGGTHLNRGGHDMTNKYEIDQADIDKGESGYAWENVAYDDGQGNGGEDVDGYYVASETDDEDPVDSDD